MTKANPGRPPSAGPASPLGQISLFSELSDSALAALATRCTERAYRRGEFLWHAGDEGTELLVVLSGELEVLGASQQGTELVVGQIGPGECVGEMALILDARRSATVRCSRSARVLAVGKSDFRETIRGDARSLGRLSEIVSRRAMSLAKGERTVRATIVVGVVADPGVHGASLVAAAVADLAADMPRCSALLLRVGRHGVSNLTLSADGRELAVALREREGRAPLLDVACAGVPTSRELTRIVNAVLAAFGGRFRLVVVDLPPLPIGGIESAALACDDLVHVTASHAPVPAAATGGRVLQVVNQFGSHEATRPLNHCEPFILPREAALTGPLGNGRAFSALDARLPALRVLRRLTRKLLGATVGIALGGGAAFGIAHVGILLALEEAGLPVDLVAGTSMGSIVALGYAAGVSPPEMVDIARRIGNVRTTLSVLDPSITGTGLLNGRRLVAIFSPLLPRQTFEELVLPCRVVAMDLETGERVDIGSGRLDAAFRASCSIPIVFTPVRQGERTLIDGGMLDPVPADVAREMGADIVIAVNVVPRLQQGVSTVISRAFKRVNRLNPLSYLGSSRGAPDIVDVFMNSLQIVEYELGNFKSLVADVRVNVDMAEFTWIEFYRALELIERGRQAGESAVPEVRALLEARLAPV